MLLKWTGDVAYHGHDFVRNTSIVATPNQTIEVPDAVGEALLNVTGFESAETAHEIGDETKHDEMEK